MKKTILALFALLFTASCVETVVVGGAAGIVVATREKSLMDTKDDVLIAAKIDSEFLKNGLKTPNNNVSTMVNESRVLLIGEVRDGQKGKLAQEISWKVKGVREVIDEIKITDTALSAKNAVSPFSDTVVTSWLKTKLFFRPNVVSSNFKINTFQGSVYLFGVAKNESEMKKVLTIASQTRGVKRVVNHIILQDDPRRK